MATYYARASGNINGAIWATTPAGAAGSVTFDPADILVANSFSITVNVDVTVAQVRNDTFGGATTGGNYTLTTGVTLTANVFGANTPCVNFTVDTTATITGNIAGQITTNITTGTVLHSSLGTLTINGNVTGSAGPGSTNSAVSINNRGTLIINGNVTGGTSSDSPAIRVLNAFGSTTVINGAITGGANNALNYGVVVASGNTLTVNTGPITGGASAAAVQYTSIVPAMINCAVIGPPSGTAPGFNFTAAIGLVTFNGPVTGRIGPAITNASTGAIIVNNTVTGGSAGGVGISNTSAGTVTVNGTVIGGVGGAGLSNSSVGRVIVTRAKGNGFGIGSTGLTAQVGVSNTSTGFCIVSEIEYGDLGMSPTSGPIIMTDLTSNIALLYRSGMGKQTLIDANTTASLLPAAADVRKGVSYNAGNNVGTMDVPAAASVALGVAVDNTTGTAAMTAAAIWDELTSNTRVVGSYGERLKTVSTVASTGQQLVDALG